MQDLGVDGRVILKLCVIIYILFIFKVHIFVGFFPILKWILIGGGGQGLD